MRQAVIVSAARTPVGRFNGALSPVMPHQLAALPIREAVRRAGIDAAEIDEVIFGNIYAHQFANVARMALLEADLPVTVPGVTLNRVCGSGLNAIGYAAALVEQGMYDCVLAGGIESDSNRVWCMEKAPQSKQFAPPRWIERKMVPEKVGTSNMIETAENVAERYAITREECDAFAVESHRKAAKAWENGVFDSQIVPVEVIGPKGKASVVAKDEVFRPDCSMEMLGKLRLASKRSNGVVTAGNACPLSDGAGAVIVMERSAAEAKGLKPLAICRDFTSVALDPNYMGLGPVYACRKLMERTGLTMQDVDIIELNEAFASQSIACARELNLDMSKVNVNGGAIALGHPLGGTGAILMTKLVYEMQRRSSNNRYGLITFCCGGGQGVAMLIEKC